MEDNNSGSPPKKDKPLIQIALGSEVRVRRLALGVSQEGFADHAGFHRTYIGSLERGEINISLGNLYAIAIALNCQPHDLIVPISKGMKVNGRLAKS